MTIVKRVAAGAATLALAFSALAGTDLPAQADVTQPAAPLSALPQSGASPQLVGSVTAAQVSLAKKKKKKKKSKGAKALAFAKKQLGDRYRYGGTGPDAWDCSGLTRGAWKAAGKKIPRTSQAQSRFGKKVKKSKLKRATSSSSTPANHTSASMPARARSSTLPGPASRWPTSR